MPSLQPIGCYRDTVYDRALPAYYANFRDQIIWSQMELTVDQCARVAHDEGFEYFAVQFYGECYGGKDAKKTYAKFRESTECWEFDKGKGFGVGASLSNFVYRIKQVCKRHDAVFQ